MSQITWRSIATPGFVDPTRGNEAYQNSLKGLGNFLGSQIDIQSKLAEETKAKANAETMYNFKNALAGAMDSPEAIQAGITSGAYGQLASQMGVDPEQARGFLDINKLLPEAYTRQSQQVARDEAAQLKASLPIIQGLESRLMAGLAEKPGNGLTAQDLMPAVAQYAQAGMLAPGQELALRKSLLGLQDDTVNRQVTAENRIDVERRRTEERSAAAEKGKLKQEMDLARSRMQPMVAGLSADANQGEFLFNLGNHLRQMPGVSVAAANAVAKEAEEQLRAGLRVQGPAEQQKAAAINQQNQEAIKNYQNVVEVAKRSRDAELKGLDLPGGFADSMEGTELIEKAMASIGLPSGTKDGDGGGDQAKNVRGVISNYYDKLPAATIAKAIKQASPDRPLFGSTSWFDWDNDRSTNIKTLLDAELKKPNAVANMRKIKEINERVLESERRLTEQERALYGDQAPKK